MKKKILFIDKKLAKGSRMPDDCLILLPSYKNDLEWNIKFKDQTLYNAEIIKLKNRLANLFAREVYCKKLNYNIDSCETLFHGAGGLITFVVADRLLRLNKLFCHLGENNVVVPEVEYEHDNTIDYGEFFYNVVEQSPEFNQWLLNELLPNAKVEKNEINNTTQIDIEYHQKKEKNNSYLVKIQNHLIKLFLSNDLSFREKADSLLNSTLLIFKKSLFNTLRVLFVKSAPLVMDSCDHTVSSKLCDIKSIWPIGNFSVLNVRKINYSNGGSAAIKRESIGACSDQVANAFKEFLASCGENIYLQDDTFNNISFIYSKLMPKFFVEDVDYACKEAIKDFNRLKAKAYFCNGTHYSHVSTLNIFACRETKKKVIATQHSAWGGYLLNGSLVSEVLINGCDDYVTFGWNNKANDGTSVWRGRAIEMPSPMLSQIYIENINNNLSVVRNDSSKSVLLCLSFMYRFPSIYNSFLRWDNINDWADAVSNIIQKLANDDIEVTISMYNNAVAETLQDILFDFESIHPNVKIIKDHDIRIRKLMGSPEFDNRYSAVIWDVPSGGFTEAIAYGKKAFALWNEKLISNQDSSQDYIDNLLRQKVFFPNGEVLTDTINHTIKDPSWYYETKRKKAIDDFMDEYARIDPNWKNEWKKLITILGKNEI